MNLLGDKPLFAVLANRSKCPHLCIINQREQRSEVRREIDQRFADFHEIIQGKPVPGQTSSGAFFFFGLILGLGDQFDEAYMPLCKKANENSRTCTNVATLIESDNPGCHTQQDY